MCLTPLTLDSKTLVTHPEHTESYADGQFAKVDIAH